MALGKPLPVRIDTDVDQRLEEIAKNAGSTKSALIRLLIDTFSKHCVDAQGTVTLPPNWKDILAKSDGRSGGPYVLTAAAHDALGEADKKDVENLPPSSVSGLTAEGKYPKGKRARKRSNS